MFLPERRFYTDTVDNKTRIISGYEVESGQLVWNGATKREMLGGFMDDGSVRLLCFYTNQIYTFKSYDSAKKTLQTSVHVSKKEKGTKLPKNIVAIILKHLLEPEIITESYANDNEYRLGDRISINHDHPDYVFFPKNGYIMKIDFQRALAYKILEKDGHYITRKRHAISWLDQIKLYFSKSGRISVHVVVSGGFIIGADLKAVIVYDIENNEELTRIGCFSRHEIRDFGVSGNDKVLFVATSHGTIFKWNIDKIEKGTDKSMEDIVYRTVSQESIRFLQSSHTGDILCWFSAPDLKILDTTTTNPPVVIKFFVTCSADITTNFVLSPCGKIVARLYNSSKSIDLIRVDQGIGSVLKKINLKNKCTMAEFSPDSARFLIITAYSVEIISTAQD